MTSSKNQTKKKTNSEFSGIFQVWIERFELFLGYNRYFCSLPNNFSDSKLKNEMYKKIEFFGLEIHKKSHVRWLEPNQK